MTNKTADKPQVCSVKQHEIDMKKKQKRHNSRNSVYVATGTVASDGDIVDRLVVHATWVSYSDHVT